MNDPAIEAAQRVWKERYGLDTPPWSTSIAAAREALKPIRIWYESNMRFLEAGYIISLDGLAKLIYSENELMSRRKNELSVPTSELPKIRAEVNASMRLNIGKPGYCHNCGWPLRHPSDTNCRECFASDTDET